ncbi:unnamed protein product [Absidia cylindrospora]
MHILSPRFLANFPRDNVMNLHPALPGQFDGAHAIDRAFEAFQQGTITETGIMVHKVIADVDRGQVIYNNPCPSCPPIHWPPWKTVFIWRNMISSSEVPRLFWMN